MSAATHPIIALMTDFGLADPYVGMMKGVMLGIAPDCRVVDITHHIPAHDILEAALVLRTSYRFFPTGTIFVVVVDPGVGSSRRPILIRTERYFLVGPDNGVLSLACELEECRDAFHLTSRKYFLDPVSNTFHGRDLFSPVAAWLSRGTAPELLGERVPSFEKLDLPAARRSGNALIGSVLRIDSFGNLITNISRQDLATLGTDADVPTIEIGEKVITRMCCAYAEAEPGEVFAIWGSSGLLEISANQASAAQILEANRHQEFLLCVAQRSV
jgi:Uncharacterized conserved protein